MEKKSGDGSETRSSPAHWPLRASPLRTWTTRAAHPDLIRLTYAKCMWQGASCETPFPFARRQPQAPEKLCEPEILTRSLLFIHHHSSGRLSQFQPGAHLLNLRGLVFYCCRETRNRGFQFRDPLLLLLEFIECRLVLGALRSAYSHLLPTGIDKVRA